MAMKKFLIPILFIFLIIPVLPVLALDTDIYILTYEQIQVQPDALLILDLSGSMRWTPAGETMYISTSQSCGTNVAYYNNNDSPHTKACDIDPYGTVPKYSNETCTGPFYRTARTDYTTDCSRLEIAKRAIHGVLDDDGDNDIDTDDEASLNVRFGYMRFYDGNDTAGNYNSGNIRLIKGIGTHYSEIMTSVNGASANSGTPLASSLNEAKLYLNAHKAEDTAKDCRQKFAILITDGADTYACGGSGSESQSDQYKRRRETVAKAKALADAGYKVFVVGFGADMPYWLRNTLNRAAYYGGTKNSRDTQSGDPTAYNPASVTYCQNSSTFRPNPTLYPNHYAATSNDPGELSLTGYAFLATSAEELGLSIKAIAKYIADLNRESTAYVAPVVPISQMEKTSAGNRMYLGMFKPSDRSFWKGNIKKFGIATEDSGYIKIGDIIDQNGNLVMNDANQIRCDSTYCASSYWSLEPDGEEVEKGGLGAILLQRDFSANPRKIYTYFGNNNLTHDTNAFRLSNAAVTPELLAASDSTERDNIINFIHGFDAYDWYGPCGEAGPDPGEEIPDGRTDLKRCWVLGAFIHSRPLILHYEQDQSTIFVGGNDGMLHAFDDATGEELWAFIPPNLLPRLKNLNGPLIEFFVDGSPKVYTERDSSGNLTKAILIFGQRRGGNYYTALDVTNRLAPTFLWKISPSTSGFAELGQTWSTPQIGKIKNGLGEKWVVFIGAGYDTNQDFIPVVSPDSKGRAVYVVDVLTGNLIWKYSYQENNEMRYCIPSDISRVDTNGDGKIDRLYVGDVGGRIWRFDIGDAGNTGSWTGKIIFTGQGKIFYPPDVTLENDAGIYEMLFFGTGDRENPRGELDITNRLYAVKDMNPSSPLTESGLEDVTTDELQDPNTTAERKAEILANLRSKKGWLIRLDQYLGEKCLASPLTFYGGVYYTTFAPSMDSPSDICYLGVGKGILYIVDYKTGNAVFNLDATNDTDGVETIKRSDRSKVIGAAIPSGAIITIIGGRAAGYIGVGGGVHIPELIKKKSLVPLNWRIVF
jgi:hypothetical protein